MGGIDLIIFGAIFLAIVFVVLGLLPPLRGSLVYLFAAAFVCLLIAIVLFIYGSRGGHSGASVFLGFLA